MTISEKTGRAAASFAADDHRTSSLVEDGELVVVPTRSGGPFDLCGARGADVRRAADLVALIDAHAGRWLLVTLTVDRKKFLSPEIAYTVAGERVREVVRVLSLRGIHATAFEVQSKTGDGWPHWHSVIWAPDRRPIARLRAMARKAWSFVEVVPAIHTVDQDTGEEIEWVPERRRREPIGFVDLTLARDRKGVARYTSKYLTKRWFAVPPWMGESFRQLRKLRFGDKCFDWLESVGRHVRKRRAEQPPPKSPETRVSERRRRRRRLFDRMAASGMSITVMRRCGRHLVFEAALKVPAGPELHEFLAVRPGCAMVRGGPFPRCRWRMSELALDELRSVQHRPRFAELAEREQARARVEIAAMWDEHQERAWDGGPPDPG